MVAIQRVHASNALISNLPGNLVALFLGATSGIGRSTLVQFAAHAVQPQVYIVARRASAIADLVEELHEKNPAGSYTVVEKDVSLIRETNDVVEFVLSKETKLDFLFESVGFISFSGRQETSEGLDASMTTRYYSRLRALQGMIPLLNAAASPRVVSILAGGGERKLNEDDLDLRTPGTYSVVAAAIHSATMLTLSYEYLARQNPRISFVHAYPGLVATPIFSKGSTGLVKLLAQCIVQPVANSFGTSAGEAGARALFYMTSDRYSVNDGLVPLVRGLERSARSGGGVFLSNQKSESVDNEKILSDLRTRKVDEKVWAHTMDVFEACRANASK